MIEYNNMKKFFGWLFALGIAGGLIYLFAKSSEIFSLMPEPTFTIKEDIRGASTTTARPQATTVPPQPVSRSLSKNIIAVQKEAADRLKATTDIGSAAARETSKSILETAKEKTINLVEGALAGIGNAAKSILGGNTEDTTKQAITVTQSPSSPTRYIRYLSKADEPISFLIKNPDAGLTLTYHIDWGDGNRENADILPNQTKTASHEWTRSGDYIVTFRITITGASPIEHQVRVVVGE